MMKNTIVLQSQTQKAIWLEEITGQLSDGTWENATPRDHWKFWCQLDVLVDDHAPPHVEFGKADFYRPSSRRYNLLSLLNIGTKEDPDYCIRDRMIFKARMAHSLAVLGREYDAQIVGAGEYIGGRREEFFEKKANPALIKHEWEKRYFAAVDEQLADEYFSTGWYTTKDLKQDLAAIKAAMLTATKHW